MTTAAAEQVDAQYTTAGVDLASQPQNTAVCVINWGQGYAEVAGLSSGYFYGELLNDATLLEIMKTVDKVAVDAPFGWPEPFARAINSEPGKWPLHPDQPRAPLERRTTDVLVWERTRKTPLSVTTDRIAYCAMRCAALLGVLGTPRDGSGRAVEAYPDAALRCWLPTLFTGVTQSYKTKNNPLARARREVLLTALVEQLGDGFHITGAQRTAIAYSDDCLDAFVCALLARAAALNRTVLPSTPQHRALAEIEGWIHLPEPGSLTQLVKGPSQEQLQRKEVLRSVYRGQLPDCPNGNKHTINILATYTAADGLTVKASESTTWPCDDIDSTYHVAPDQTDRLRATLGAVGGYDLLELIAQKYTDGTIPVLSLDSWLTDHGVTYSASERRHPN